MHSWTCPPPGTHSTHQYLSDLISPRLSPPVDSLLHFWPPAGSSSQLLHVLSHRFALAWFSTQSLPGQALTSRLTPSSLARWLPDSASKNSLRGWGDSKQTNKQNTGRLWFPLLVFRLPGARTHLWCRNITMHHTEPKWWSVLGVARQPPGSRPLRWSQQEQEHCPQHQPCWRPFRAAAIPGCCVTGT